jgi:hypothetical protein
MRRIGESAAAEAAFLRLVDTPSKGKHAVKFPGAMKPPLIRQNIENCHETLAPLAAGIPRDNRGSK